MNNIVFDFEFFLFFFFNVTATTEIYTLSLHDALPISSPPSRASSPAIRASTTASMAEARIGMARSMPQKVWARSTSDGSMVLVPGASETSSKPYVGRRWSTLDRKARRWAASVPDATPLLGVMPGASGASDPWRNLASVSSRPRPRAGAGCTPVYQTEPPIRAGPPMGGRADDPGRARLPAASGTLTDPAGPGAIPRRHHSMTRRPSSESSNQGART